MLLLQNKGSTDTLATRQTEATQRSIRNHLLAIGAGAGVLVFGFGTMAATVRLAGAVMASGTVAVRSNVKKISHPNGGIVGTLPVADGTRVRAGDLLVHLDETVAAANSAALTQAWYELGVQRARLEAERDGRASLSLPADLAPFAQSPQVAAIVMGETALLEQRRRTRDGQKEQMRQRIAQLNDEIGGLRHQDEAKATELGILEKELEGIQYLYDRSLVQLTRLDSLKRDVTRIKGERGALAAQMAQARGKIAETELQIIQVDEEMRADDSKQLSDIRAKTSDIVQKRIAALDLLTHLDIRSPQDGIVHDLAVHAKGAVIAPNEPVLTIVPDDDDLVAEVRVEPRDIDKVYSKQDATLRFPNLNQRTTPEVVTHVIRVAADTTADGKGGAPYYTVQLAIPEGAVDADVKLRQGMPVDAMIATSQRTMLSYLLKPLTDQISRAFREK